MNKTLKKCGATITNQTLFNEVTKSQLKWATLTNLSELCDMLSLEVLDRADHEVFPENSYLQEWMRDISQTFSIQAMALRNAQRATDDAKEIK